MGKNYYIADLHFGHFNILRFDNRPYFTVNEMNTELINNWNSVVNEDDEVYILGDVSWGSMEKTLEILKQLKGKKYLIRGNHDTIFHNSFKEFNEFQWIKDYAEIKDNDRNIVLSHYPMPCYKNMMHGWYHLFGHIHSTKDSEIIENALDTLFQTWNLERRTFNVGCMKWWMNYTPKTLGQIIEGYNNYIKFLRKEEGKNKCIPQNK